ncbi:MAG: exo-alpha-sialidase, partial [Gemmatimonadetes bacterium]|nr:exo-alpha-sialidase [Gemmatimonadota bacterium]
GSDGTLWAHYLERGGKGTYDYAVRVVRSDDGGVSWSEPVTPHDDRSPTEHGFVSTIPTTDGMGFVWLDGRRYVDAEGKQATREMTLRFRRLGADGTLGEETLLDGRVCDCCQTSSAMTDAGPVTVYRDRSPDEIRDIYITRSVDGEWSEGAPVHEDGWEIAGCPVNGPAVVASGMDVAVAWFTGAGDIPKVKVAFSHDAGNTFGDPVVIDDGNPAGRVDLLFAEEGAVLVTWLERTGGDAAEVRVRRVAPSGAASASVSLVGSSGARASGFPRVVSAQEGAVMLAWTDLEGGVPQVRVARLVVEGALP